MDRWIDVVTVESKCMCVQTKAAAESSLTVLTIANHCYMGHHRPQAKEDLKLQGFINQIMSRVRSSKLNRRLVFTSATYSALYYEIIRSAKQSDGYSEHNKYQTKWGLLSLSTFSLNIFLVFFLLQWQKHIFLAWCHYISWELQQWCSPSQRLNAQHVC